ncbi:MAG: Efflux transporter, RND family, MFP subunit [Candidatus Curtissbacteria bacterium GW2011_GWA1_40_24]|uniref:Efflux transporter, RND family, MFP subunit n=1 Tax=Candidatus Curtissbacteria bacterium GW2011_GWA1_40_24 TaxID=1618406 RepID=A0A0G0RQK8_9BACT|nr:MAG: Efflux transporter, RND family, MFP subunit [Candidatus Curtissbacteria bacterium GW2011_GWA1_40_24]
MKDSSTVKIYTCPMHPEVRSDKPGSCPKCGMSLVAKAMRDKNLEPSKGQTENHAEHKMAEHKMKPVAEMSFWEKFKMGLTMTMGMEHGGIAGREMAKLMEEDIKFKYKI